MGADAVVRFGLRDRFGATICDPRSGVPLGFATREEAERYARPGDRLVELDQLQPRRRP